MGRIVRLRTSEGGRVRIVLENWGCGLDHLRRRWVRADGYWECMDPGIPERNLARVEPRFLVIRTLRP
jgi:transposase-like protein